MKRRIRGLFCILILCCCAGCAHTSKLLPKADSFEKVLVWIHLKDDDTPKEDLGSAVCLLNPAAGIPAEIVPATESSLTEAPSIQLAETVHDFGELTESGDYVHEFKLKNVGTAVLHIEKIIPG